MNKSSLEAINLQAFQFQVLRQNYSSASPGPVGAHGYHFLGPGKESKTMRDQSRPHGSHGTSQAQATGCSKHTQQEGQVSRAHSTGANTAAQRVKS